jgi:phosphopantothenoylcysteine decarboxylase/phosphopantothenate--cysteine ligase
MGHIRLSREADLVVVAPATADLIAKMAHGLADDLASTALLATDKPVLIAPAMNPEMWQHPATRRNVAQLAADGVHQVGPAPGDMACGETGVGRMAEPDEIVAAIVALLAPLARPLDGMRALVTSGPTVEAIDPVRFISNRSSGKMGYALAQAAIDAGARVVLVSGPVSLPTPDGVERVNIESAEQMYAATHERIAKVDIFISAAAVSDYRPESMQPNKIKKNHSEMHIDLVRSPDVLASVAELKDGPFTVGFAAETEKLREYAMQKLERKKLDMIVANKVGPGVGFDCNDNAAEVYWKNGERSFPLSSKARLAADLIGLIADRYAASLGPDTQTELPAIAIRD